MRYGSLGVLNRGADDVLAGSFGWMLEDKVSSEAMGVTQVRYDRTQVVTVEVVRSDQICINSDGRSDNIY